MRSVRPVISLLTDFGLGDGYVGAMKGVLARLAPEALVVDISHGIPPQDVLRGGLVWAAAVPYFPRGTIHVAVVDPGVGTRRRILAVRARGATFLAPDNGILGLVLGRGEARSCRRVAREELFLRPVSATFHGRDVFAPVAARLALGLPLADVGPACRPTAWADVPSTRTRWTGRGRSARLEERGRVVLVDSFGNAMTNLRERAGLELVAFRAGGVALDRLSRTYADVRPGRPVLLVGSSGWIEVAVREGSAAGRLGLRPDEEVVATWRRA